MDGDDCEKALELPMGDFEDALVVVCAEKANLNYIVTNDKGFLSSLDLSVSTISPADFLLKFKDLICTQTRDAPTGIPYLLGYHITGEGIC